ncbi:MAG: hypothetical protein JWO31_272, partial [Phycisphaerales bacterium]|nr:hypothetical protein [Phycisphaerales bacterium]
AIQQIPQIVGGLPEVQAEVKAAVAAVPAKAGGPATAAAGAASGAVASELKAATAPATTPTTLAAAAVPAELNPPATLPAGLTAPGALAAQGSTKLSASAQVKGLPPAGAPDPAKAAATAKVVQGRAAGVTKVQEVGGLVGRFILAVLAVYVVSRRKLIRLFQIPGLVIMPVTFALCAINGINYLYVGIFLAGLVTVAQLSFWGNYLPRMYPLHLRGTGESFAANIGGRMIGTLCFGLTQTLAVAFGPASPTPAQASHTLAYTAAAVGFGVYLIGFVLSFFLPEPGADVVED